MIAKQVSMRAMKRSDYASLVRYLLDTQNKNERVGEVRVTNCQSADPVIAAIEVLNTQSLNRRASGDKTYHLVLSFRAGEQPDAKTLRALEDRVCAALGYAEHQRVSVVHHDTDNLHVHIAINKIHPVRHTMHSPHNDHITLGRICQTLEREHGLQRDNHRPGKKRAENQSDDMEHHAGVESLIGWIRRGCWSELSSATSWASLHEVMVANGLRLHERGNGLVITAADGTTIKASSLDRQFSKARLEERFGCFHGGPEANGEREPARHYEHKPFRFRADTSALFQQYKARHDFEALAGDRVQEWERARERKAQRIAAIKRQGKLKRSVIKLLSCDKVSKRILFSAVSRTLLSEIEQANLEYFKERQRIYLKYKRATWADWLHAEAMQGNDEALSVLRSREGASGNGINTLAGRRPGKAQRPAAADGLTKHGTIIICAGKTVLRDDGDKLAVTRGFEEAGLQAALRFAAERYGTSLRVDGTNEFRERIARAAASARLSITFDDAALEARRRELIQATTTKEASDEPRQHTRQGRPADSGIQADGGGGIGTASPVRTTGSRKPNVDGPGKAPPPQSQNRLRRLSQLGMVRLPGGGEVLLPGDVPRHLEQQGPAADHRLRRPVSGAGQLARKAGRAQAGHAPAKVARSRIGVKPPPAGRGRLRELHDPGAEGGGGPMLQADTKSTAMRDRQKNASASQPVPQHETSAIAASAKYAFEREQRRRTLSDIPKHIAYDGFQGPAAFAGLRTVDDQQLALLNRGGEIMVVPVDEATARRLKRLKRGDVVTVASHGAIKTQGRSR
ncbi:TraI/MobA(P) family conjugative relaxase [Rugamonas rivuli]|uniref:Relaxase/mobilization nuclease domain-containing protein n=1 Tax=Rugamonas rivuli TaxID=2743358 RepID=A0A843SI50_9BURK|nr:TraI/MobA(P) family conjugative relaxase [Rugamonas rivuli]MQA21674.1 relaxase/mobilization nuclease domain-containing protein [Rugamonas rivuli]